MVKPIYCAIDVDDQAFSVAILSDNDETPLYFRTAPVVSVLLKKITDKGFSLKHLQLCYEATYLGFDLYRKLNKAGVFCEIIAPTSIPCKPGKKVKTDRIDANKLVQFYQKGILTPIYVPTEQDEMVRRVIRSRALLQKEAKRLKKHITSNCRLMGWHYREETGNPRGEYWTGTHRQWFKVKTKKLPEGSFDKFNFLHLLNSLENIEAQVELYSNKIQEIGESEEYSQMIKAVVAFKGLDTLSALTLIVELADINRFPKPGNAVSFAGMAIAEYSSGGKEKRFGITKQGNSIIRTTLVEATQSVFNVPNVSKKLKKRREGTEPELINIADRCMHRLHKKATNLFHRGKEKNKIKIACAREMLCFIWEALKHVSETQRLKNPQAGN